MGCPPQLNAVLTASGTGEDKTYPKASSAADTAMDLDLLNQKLKWEKANPCPAGCTFEDVWTDLPVVTPPPAADGQPKPLKKLAFQPGYSVTVKESVGIHRTCYDTEAKRKDGKDAREEAERKAREEEAKKAKKAAESGDKK
jgi:hypothetical protein